MGRVLCIERVSCDIESTSTDNASETGRMVRIVPPIGKDSTSELIRNNSVAVPSVFTVLPCATDQNYFAWITEPKVFLLAGSYLLRTNGTCVTRRLLFSTSITDPKCARKRIRRSYVG